MTTLERFIIARWMYSIGEPIMEDPEYTLLLGAIQKDYPDSEYVHRSWSSDPCPVELLQKYGYGDAIRNIVLSDKTESIPSINDWYTLQDTYEDLDEDATLSLKHDGWNTQASYYNGVRVGLQTRGRFSDAICVKVLGDKIPETIPQMGRVTVCMEATVSQENHMILKREINSRSQRGAVSSCLARPEYTHMIDMHAFSIIGDEQILNPFPVLEEWGFQVVRWESIHNYQELLAAMYKLDKEYKVHATTSDGLVVRASSTRAIRLLSWEEPIYRSFVQDYDETYGAYRVGVKVKIYPIAMRNSTQRLVSCTNYQRIIDNNLRIGYPIAFRLSSMAIADLDESSTRLLQEEWDGREEEYCKWVEEGELVKLEVQNSGMYMDDGTTH